MKNLMITLLVGFVIIFGASCSKKVVVSQSKQQPTQGMNAEKPVVWKQAYYPKLAIGDPILFFNSTEIIMDGSSSDQTILLQDGSIHILDSILTVTKTVPSLTPGVLKMLKKSSDGKIQIMGMSFSQEDKTYELNFPLKSDGSYTLNANAKLFFRGKEYKILAITKGGECLLLVNISLEKNVEAINEKAEGQSVSGTKVIK